RSEYQGPLHADKPENQREKKCFKTIIKRPPVYRKIWRPKTLSSRKEEGSQNDKDNEQAKGEEAGEEAEKVQTMMLENTNPVKLNMEVDEKNEKVYIHFTISNAKEMDKITPLPHQGQVNENNSLKYKEPNKTRQGKAKELLESITRDLNEDKEFVGMEELIDIEYTRESPVRQQLIFDKYKEEGENYPCNDKEPT
ncbi:hypothetical protein KI387_033049, partial [Taxus chinensis]